MTSASHGRSTSAPVRQPAIDPESNRSARVGAAAFETRSAPFGASLGVDRATSDAVGARASAGGPVERGLESLRPEEGPVRRRELALRA